MARLCTDDFGASEPIPMFFCNTICCRDETRFQISPSQNSRRDSSKAISGTIVGSSRSGKFVSRYVLTSREELPDASGERGWE